VTVSERNAQPHSPELDGLRGCAILLVVAGHLLAFSLDVGGRWNELGGLGVLIFFGLSGFLITSILCREEARSGSISLRAFYARRALRIFPAFGVFIGVASILLAVHLITDATWLTVLASILYVRNIFGRGHSLGHLWSLSLEEQFYLVWPLFLRFVTQRRALFPTLALVVAITTWRTVAILFALFDYNRGIFYLRPDFRFDSILVGCALALALARAPLSGRRLSIVLAVSNPVWVVPTLLAWTLFAEFTHFGPPIFLTVQTILATLFLVHVVLGPGTITCRILRNRLLQLIGRLSYSIYLWQQIFLVTREPSWGPLRVFPLNLVMCAALAVASYVFVERPFLRLKARVVRPPATIEAVVVLDGRDVPHTVDRTRAENGVFKPPHV